MLKPLDHHRVLVDAVARPDGVSPRPRPRRERGGAIEHRERAVTGAVLSAGSPR